MCACTILQPGATVDVNDLTPEQAENSVTIVFAGITVRLVAPLIHYCVINNNRYIQHR